MKSTLARSGLLVPARALRRGVRSVRRSVSPAARAKAKRARERRQRALAFYGQWLAPGDLCFDIGANVGHRIELFRTLDATVVAAEPQASCLETLRRRFGGDPRVVLVPEGIGPEIGTGEFYVSSDSETSSMSREWIDAVAERLTEHSWSERRTVPITTLDALIAAHGVPAFCKIDVEGFEFDVLRGLSSALPVLSFEYTPERLEPAHACIERLTSLGAYEFNLSREVDFQLATADWLDAEGLRALLDAERGSHRSGDVYARLR